MGLLRQRASAPTDRSSARELSRDRYLLLFIVARSRLDRYDELLWQLGGSRRVKVVLDRREGERRIPQASFAGVDRRLAERRHQVDASPYLKLGWAVVETDESIS